MEILAQEVEVAAMDIQGERSMEFGAAVEMAAEVEEMKGRLAAVQLALEERAFMADLEGGLLALERRQIDERTFANQQHAEAAHAARAQQAAEMVALWAAFREAQVQAEGARAEAEGRWGAALGRDRETTVAEAARQAAECAAECARQVAGVSAEVVALQGQAKTTSEELRQVSKEVCEGKLETEMLSQEMEMLRAVAEAAAPMEETERLLLQLADQCASKQEVRKLHKDVERASASTADLKAEVQELRQVAERAFTSKADLKAEVRELRQVAEGCASKAEAEERWRQASASNKAELEEALKGAKKKVLGLAREHTTRAVTEVWQGLKGMERAAKEQQDKYFAESLRAVKKVREDLQATQEEARGAIVEHFEIVEIFEKLSEKSSKETLKLMEGLNTASAVDLKQKLRETEARVLRESQATMEVVNLRLADSRARDDKLCAELDLLRKASKAAITLQGTPSKVLEGVLAKVADLEKGVVAERQQQVETNAQLEAVVTRQVETSGARAAQQLAALATQLEGQWAGLQATASAQLTNALAAASSNAQQQQAQHAAEVEARFLDMKQEVLLVMRQVECQVSEAGQVGVEEALQQTVMMRAEVESLSGRLTVQSEALVQTRESANAAVVQVRNIGRLSLVSLSLVSLSHVSVLRVSVSLVSVV
jgi:hypothetical protein